MKPIKLLALAVLFPMIAACNTIAGAGEDISKGGEKLEKSAEKHKNY